MERLSCVRIPVPLNLGTTCEANMSRANMSMGGSSTTVESLVCGTPAYALDDTDRNWSAVVDREDVIVKRSIEGLCTAVSQFLVDGISNDDWEQVRYRIAYNFGPEDAVAIYDLRSAILSICGRSQPLATEVRSFAMNSSTPQEAVK